MAAEGWLELMPMEIEASIAMHSHGYDLKKRGTFIRLKLMRLLGKTVPDYGYVLKGFGFSRVMMELVIDTLFVVLGTRLARWMVEQLPPTFVGNLFEKSRNIWKKSTKNIKQQKL
jgi:hypothetical protein